MYDKAERPMFVDVGHARFNWLILESVSLWVALGPALDGSSGLGVYRGVSRGFPFYVSTNMYILKRGTPKAACSIVYGSIQHSQFNFILNLAYKRIRTISPRREMREV